MSAASTKYIYASNLDDWIKGKEKNVGRPIGVKKDPDILKIKNPNGRLIIYNGPQFTKLIKQGYVVNNNKLELGPDGLKEIPKGRPKGSKKVIENKNDKVLNPFSKYLIKINGPTFKKLMEHYHYNSKENKIYGYTNHPRTLKEIKIKSDKYNNKILKKGYIHEVTSNDLFVPSEISNKAFDESMIEYKLKVINDNDVIIQMNALNARIKYLLKKNLEKMHGITFNINFGIEMKKLSKEDNSKHEYNLFYYNSPYQNITHKSMISNTITAANQHINGVIEKCTQAGSGYVIDNIFTHYLKINKFSPLAAKSYIPLIPEIANRKATINIQNKKDNKCFMYCLGRKFDPNPEKNNLERVSKHLRNVCTELGFDQIKMPVSMKDIPKIEEKFKISINVYGHNESQIYVIRTSNKIIDENSHINLLITSNEDTNHYIWIKDFNKLNAKVTKNEKRKYFCYHCLHHFPRQKLLDDHKSDCIVINKSQATKLPNKGTFTSFRSLGKTIGVPFVIYADLESLLIPIQGPTKNPIKSYSFKKNEHKPCSYGYKTVCSLDDKLSSPYKTFRGKNSITKFFTSLFQEEKRIYECMKKFKKTPIIMTNDEIKKYCTETNCYVCGTKFDNKEPSKKKVKDHCHITGKFRGAACNDCNLKLRLTRKIPVIFHNLRGYDSHLLMQKLGQFNKKINIIPNNMEKYMSFSVGTEFKYFDKKEKKWKKKTEFNLRFIDSFQFMSSSLDKLIQNLKGAGLDRFKYTRQEFGNNTELLTRKGVYPYSYMNSWNKFDVNPRTLKIEDFKDDLTGNNINEKDFAFYKEICEKFCIKNFG